MTFKLLKDEEVAWCFQCGLIVVYRDNLCANCLNFQLVKGIP